MAETIAERYELVRLIGSGEFGEVYEALDLMLGRSRVAIKIFHDNVGADPRAASRFGREVLAMTRVNHPNVIRFFDILNHGERFGYSMEHVRGVSLDKLIDKGPRFSYKEIRSILSQLCQGTAAIHEKNLVHRDLKPENVIITDTGVCKIVDFGVVHLLGRAKPIFSGDLLDVGGLAGTPDFIAPEALLDAEPRPSADVYAIGVIGFVLITGHAPFAHYNMIESLKKRLVENPLPPVEYRPDCPFDLSEVIRRALIKDPDLRFRDPVKLQAALEECLLDYTDEADDERAKLPVAALSQRVHKALRQEHHNEETPAIEAFGNTASLVRWFDVALVGTLFSVVVMLAAAVAFPRHLLHIISSVRAISGV